MTKPVIIVVAALIFEEKGRILITRRHDDAHFGGYWEFPGGRIEDGEGPDEALVREIREEVNLNIDVQRLYHHEVFDYGDRVIDISFYLCRPEPPAQTVERLDVADFAWVETGELDQYAFPRADASLVKMLKMYRIV